MTSRRLPRRAANEDEESPPSPVASHDGEEEWITATDNHSGSWQTPPRPPRFTTTTTTATRTPQHPAIYSVPTTDTFGEEDSWHNHMRLAYASPMTIRNQNSYSSAAEWTPDPIFRHNNNINHTSATARLTTPSQRQRRQQQQQQQSLQSTTHHNGDRISIFDQTPLRSNHSTQYSGGSGVPPPSLAVKIPLSSRRKRRVPKRLQLPPPDGRQQEHQEFMAEIDAPSVTVQFVATAVRSAYHVRAPPAWEDYMQTWERASRIVSSTTKQRATTAAVLHKRLSPSPQHLQVLHALAQQNWLRQVDYATSMGTDTDVPHDENAKSAAAGDGQYCPLQVVQAYLGSLPAVPPQLSHRRARLPNRADVGFPGATEAEIVLKQREMSYETAWEEATPRLVLLCTADDLGKLVVSEEEDKEQWMESIDDYHVTVDDGHVEVSPRRRRRRGLPGMPYAGRPLIRAAMHNAKEWGRPLPIDASVYPNLHYHPTSLLAPPRQATYSRSLHWRPRLFHDRAPGREYVVACPVDLVSNSTTSEPFVLSLALYQLPSHDNPARGKVSEDVYFPVGGEWQESTWSAMKQQQSDSAPWRQRKLKAILSVDPSIVSQLVWVMRVYKLPNLQSFQQFGWDLLVPCAWGVLPWSGLNQSTAWPQGKTSHVPLYSWTSGESPDNLMDRIAQIVNATDSTSPVGGDHSLSYSNSVVPSSAASAESDSVRDTSSATAATPSKKGISRLFRSPRLTKNTSKSSAVSSAPYSIQPSSSKPVLSKVLLDSIPMADLQPLDGWGLNVFLSFLGTDFLSALLSTPNTLPSPPNWDIPRLLVDPTGDAAVSIPPQPQRVANLPQDDPKRSDLVRLPPLAVPAGYTDAAEFREVLPMQPRVERQYPLDTPFGTRSLVNLLYLYPRVLRLSSSADPKQPRVSLENVTVRVRLVQNEISLDEETGNILYRNLPLPNLHSPVPWASENLIDHMYTKVQGSMAGNPGLDLNMGVSFGEEIKVRMPEILDGSFTLEFSLVQVHQQLDGVSLTFLGETNVPLSSSSRESSTGSKVSTVIPNGNHRVKIGDYQLQVETRLVSSIHVSDPAVALTLRDFPYAKFQDEMNTEPLENRLSSSRSVDSAVDFNDSFPSLLATSNPSAVVAHFGPLLHMHLCNLVNLNERGRNDISAALQFISGNMMSFFEVLRCVKAAFALDPFKDTDSTAMLLMLKEVVDGFDEGYLSSGSSLGREPANYVEESPAKEDQPAIERSASTDSAMSVASLGEGSVRMQGRRKLHKKYEERVSKIVAALGNSGTPFSRVAYGASKSDRMRVEAEIDTGDHMFDDDETIMTELTSPRGGQPDEIFDYPKNTNDSGLIDAMRKELSANSILHSASSGLKDQNQKEGQAQTERSSGGGGGNDFARRMRNAAQTMLAPCVGPSISNILASARGTSLPTQTMSDAGQTEEDSVSISKVCLFQMNHRRDKNLFSFLYFSQQSQEGKTGVVFLPGSDDEANEDDRSRRLHVRPSNGDRVFRGAPDVPVFIFSSTVLDEHGGVFVGGHFLYESVIALWLRSWSEHFLPTISPKHHGLASSSRFVAFPLPPFDPRRPVENSIVSFFHHMDMLLPLCLKSIVVRYATEVLPIYPAITRVQLDEHHRMVFEKFAGILARGLVGMALSGLGSAEATEKALRRAVSASDAVVEFLIGLIPIFHSEHMRVILTKYLKVLKDTETEHLGETAETDFEWNEESLLRVRSSRQLRLHAIELLTSLPSFCHLNYPCKVEDAHQQSKPAASSWLHQYMQNNEHIFEEITTIPEYPDGLQRVPTPGWLSRLVIDEALSVCSLSSEAVIAEALAHAEVSRQQSGTSTSGVASSLKKRPGASLQRGDLLMFQSLSIHAINIVYELVLRRNSVDRRFQSDSTRRRIAALFALPILEKSVSSVRWLARMESTHKVRSLWLLCFVYVLQEAPDSLVQHFIRSCCDPKNIRVHRFIRLLRICSSTFQGFVNRPRQSSLPSKIDTGLSAWLLQESFNTICATTNTVVEACVDFTSNYPQEKRKVMQGLVDLLLHILTTPQSSVTHLRALGGALQAMEQFGVNLFLEVTADNFQHWARVLLSLMNSPSLSVRSISVDFSVSLLGGAFGYSGTLDDVTLVITTVLPEVVAREIALYNVSGQITSFRDISQCVWPLRRALTDIADANPLDDDRVDPQLPPRLRSFGRACQAIIDGVLVEMRIMQHRFLKFNDQDATVDLFDADEESLFEAASAFCPETSPLQRIRWLSSLKALHEKKGGWIEAAETAMLSAETIACSLQYLKFIWRPTNFALWTDSTRSHWLENVGEEIGQPDFGNREVMDFANAFLEPEDFFASTTKKSSASGRLQQPTIGMMCDMLNSIAKDSTDLYLKETGCEELALQRLEILQKTLTSSFEETTKSTPGRPFRGRRRQVEEEAILRRMMSNIAVASAKLSERVLVRAMDPQTKNLLTEPSRLYVGIRISGKKPKRFVETVALPPFLEWNEYCVCAIPAAMNAEGHEDELCLADKKALIAKQLAEPLMKALSSGPGRDKVLLVDCPQRAGGPDDDTIIEAFPVDPSASLTSLKGLTLTSRRFGYRKADLDNPTALDLTVALAFPCALSRQRSLVTSDSDFYFQY
eukprot:scaffold42062_cov176-Amphora_coffeaeformis.AAC.2